MPLQSSSLFRKRKRGESETTVIIATELLEEVANSLICRVHDAHKNLHFWKARAEGAHMQKVRFMVLERGPLAFVQGIAKLVRDCIKEHSPTQGLAVIAASQISKRTVLLHALESRLALVLGEVHFFIFFYFWQTGWNLKHWVLVFIMNDVVYSYSFSIW
ncbi:hypothetical protein L7F22_000624 [Adiantum nelumboides]|nr:hypothetical protein [Adiantum nelumboides]